MKVGVWTAIARGVVLEALRRKDLWVVGILGFMIMLSAGALGFFGLKGLESFAKDLATTVVGAFSTLLAVVASARLMPEEIKNRTLYPLLARPIRRIDLILGKMLGAVVVSWTAFLLLVGLTAISLMLFGVQFEPIMAQYVLCKLMGLVVVCAVSLTMSMFMTPAAAITTSAILLFGSGAISNALVLSAAGASPAQLATYRFINALTPQVGLFDLGSRAANTNWGPVAAWVIGTLFAYMVVYSAAMLSLSWLKFKRQAV